MSQQTHTVHALSFIYERGVFAAGLLRALVDLFLADALTGVLTSSATAALGAGLRPLVVFLGAGAAINVIVVNTFVTCSL